MCIDRSTRSVAGFVRSVAIVAALSCPFAAGADTVTALLHDPTSVDWLQDQTRRLVELISAHDVPPSVLLVALAASFVLGALHALSPGHGKTIVGAYLIGSRSTPRHAVVLGVTVTTTHTLSVFAVGALTLFASRYIVAERLFPMLSLISGLLVLAIGIVLVRQRWAAAHRALGRAFERWSGRRQHDGTASVTTTFRRMPSMAGSGASRFGIGLPRATKGAVVGDGHHRHRHRGSRAHGATDTTHSHGDRIHSHLPPGDDATWQSLIALGVSGGLVPCPSAMVLLLSAVALGKTVYGLVLVGAFSVGLASTLIAVGLAFLHAGRRVSPPTRFGDLVDLLPAASGVFIALVGLVLCYGALTSTGLVSFGE